MSGREMEQASQSEEPKVRKDHHILVDKDDDDWAWRRRIRSNPATAMPYRILVFFVGAVLVVGGLILVPLPGPGWLIVIGGLIVLASEFEPAQKVLDWLRMMLDRWTKWLTAQPWWVQGLGGLLTAAFVAAVIWSVLRIGGIPAFVPDGIDTWLRSNLWLDAAP